MRESTLWQEVRRWQFWVHVAVGFILTVVFIVLWLSCPQKISKSISGTADKAAVKVGRR